MPEFRTDRSLLRAFVVQTVLPSGMMPKQDSSTRYAVGSDAVYPFNAVQYAEMIKGDYADVSALIAPPYDVLDAEGKASLIRKSERNIVGVDLPHIPAKELGPASAYQHAAEHLARWLSQRTIQRRDEPVMFAYRQTFTYHGKQHRRSGMACTVGIKPFGPRPGGGGILPHEQTFSGPKEDRLALMKATRIQLSPIFGLHQDERGLAARLVSSLCDSRRADVWAKTDDGTLHELWTIRDAATHRAYNEVMCGEDIFIADGHHRYNTAMNYLAELEKKGPVPADHPARRCMFVLVSMSDPGLVIGPTHRVLGGMSGWNWSAFQRASASSIELHRVAAGLEGIEEAMILAAKKSGRNALGLYHFEDQSAWVAVPLSDDPLSDDRSFAGKPREWRTLDVALVQHLIVEKICSPHLNNGLPVKWAFPHSIQEVRDIGAGKERGSGGGAGFVPQVAVIVRPTPLESVRVVSRANELMPQKSTFFLPKLATGLFLNPLD